MEAVDSHIQQSMDIELENNNNNTNILPLTSPLKRSRTESETGQSPVQDSKKIKVESSTGSVTPNKDELRTMKKLEKEAKVKNFIIQSFKDVDDYAIGASKGFAIEGT